jgi:hypothetical protein
MDYPTLLGKYTRVLIKYFPERNWSCGDTYDSLEWNDETIPKPTQEELDLKYIDLLTDEIREKRNKLLQESDFTALPDYPDRDKWIVYRQELCDFPSVWTEGSEFPLKPSF